MNDMTAVIQPKSDQVNADDFIGGPRTYTIEGVAISPGTEQPVQIKLAGEPRVWRPCKSMSRVLVAGWGPDAKAYTGRSVTLYRDPKVKWGGMEVGGIRISHMSHIEKDMLIQLTATKGKRAPHVVKPLTAEVTPMKQRQTAEQWAEAHMKAIDACDTAEALDTLCNRAAKAMGKLAEDHPDTHRALMNAADARRAELSQEGKPDDQFGEGFNDDAGFGGE